MIGGTINGTGSLIMVAERVGTETMLARIVQMVTMAQRSRAPVQRLAEQISAWFVPAVVGISLLAFAAWALWGPAPSLAYALVAVVSVLIVAYPCAPGLATPMSIMVGIGKGASEGVLIRNAEALEQLEKVDTLVVDKTGTLTRGRPEVSAILPGSDFDERTLLSLAAGLERGSEHPLAAAIVEAAKQRDLTIPNTSDFRSLTGKGVVGKIAGREVVLGIGKLMAEFGIGVDWLLAAANDHRQDGRTVMLMAIDGKAAGMIAAADPIKVTTPGATATHYAVKVFVSSC